jgi:hypothetical protein
MTFHMFHFSVSRTLRDFVAMTRGAWRQLVSRDRIILTLTAPKTGAKSIKAAGQLTPESIAWWRFAERGSSVFANELLTQVVARGP